MKKNTKVLLTIVACCLLMIVVYSGSRKIIYNLYLDSGVRLEEKGDIPGALAYLEKAARYARSQSSIYARIGDVGVREYDAILVQNKESKIGKEGALDVSFRNYLASLRLNPNNPWAWSGCAEAFERKSYLVADQKALNISKLAYGNIGSLDYEDWMAIGCIKKALQIETNNHVYYDQLGFIYQENGLRPLAMEQYARSMELAPYYEDHFFIPEKEVPADMIAAIEKGMQNALRKNELIPLKWIHRYTALFFKQVGLIDKAIDHFIRSNEENDIPLFEGKNCFSLGHAYFLKDDYEKAIECFKRSNRLDPGRPYPLYYLSLIYCGKGRHDAALDYIKKAMLLMPENKTFQLQAGKELLELGRFDEADSYFRRILKERSSNKTLMAKLIEVYVNCGLRSRALSLSEEMAKEFPEDSFFREQARQLREGQR